MPDTPVSPDAFRQLISTRGLSKAAVGVLSGTHPSTVGRIMKGEVRATHQTVVALARALGIDARRMRRMCDAHYLAAQSGEPTTAREPEALRA